MSPRLVRVAGALVVLLVIVGVAAAVGRSLYPADFSTRVDPLRERAMAALDRRDPFLAERPGEVARVDARFGAHLRMTLLHVIPGGLFLLFAPLQFSGRLRRRHPEVHRWSGRVLLPLVIASSLGGLYFGILIPYAGPGESIPIALFGGLLLFAVVRAYRAIRARQVALHREWVIRVFAIAIAISTVRLVSIPLDLGLTPTGFRPPELFIYSIWIGWLLTLGIAELWIRHTRPRVDAAAPLAIAPR